MAHKRLTSFFQGSGRALLSPLLIILLALPALQPLLRRQLVCGFDNVFHLWRAVEISALLREGVLFSRWAPHMAHGYGYPLYQFQSPLSAYAAALLNLWGLGWPAALNGAYLLGLLGSALAAWWLARDLWGERGGIITAVALLFAPYHLYVAYYRASLSETVAWIFPPLVMWGLLRWQRQQQRRGLVTAVLALMLLFFTHDVTAYLFLPLFGLWAAGLGVLARGWAALRRGVIALALGVGAGAFFWLPSLLERDLIQFARAGGAWVFQPQNNFLPLSHLLALPRNADPLLLNDWPPRGLGALLALLAVAGIVAGWRRSGAPLRRGMMRSVDTMRGVTAVLTLGFAGALFLVLPLSAPLWQNELLAAFQFPWRFLAPATLTAALLAGAIANYQLPIAGSRITGYGLPITVLLAALSILHWGWLYPAACDAPADISLAGMVAWERETGTLGTTASRELLPVTVSRLPQEPDAPPPWQARLLPQDLPPGVQIVQAAFRPLGATMTLESPAPFFLRYRAFAFPGWRATIDGERAQIVPTQPDGLIAVQVPNGRSTVDISFTDTPAGLLGNALTLFALFLLVITAVRAPRLEPEDAPPRRLDRQTAVWLLALALLLIAGKWAADRQWTPLHRTRLAAEQLRGVQTPLHVTLGAPAQPALLRLWGHDALPASLPADAPLAVTLYWQALAPLTADYRVGLTLLGADGARWSEVDLRDNRWQRSPPPATGWPPHQYVQTGFYVDALPGAPPGDYTLSLSFFERESLTPLTFYDAAGAPLGPALPLGTITLTPPRQPWQAADVDVQQPLQAASETVTLLGGRVDRETAAPGDAALVTLFWSAQRASAGELALVDEAETAVAAWPLNFAAYGPGVWRTQRLLRLPVTLADGRYRWQVTTETGILAQWEGITVESPPRLLAPPAVDISIGAAFGGQVTLVGATVEETAGGVLPVELVWRGEGEMDRSYRVFVHLLGPDGALAGQSDAEPAGWTRPTTGWLPGEYVVDAHAITLPADLPPGEYTLAAGMYLPGDGRLENGRLENGRLTTVDGSDAVPFFTFIRH